MRLDLRLIVPAPAGPRVLLDEAGRLPAMTVETEDDHAAIVAVGAALRDRWRFTTPVLETHPRWHGLADGETVPTLVTTEPAAAAWHVPAGLGFGAIPDPGGLPPVLAARAAELLDEIRTGAEPPPLRPRWARRGWRARAVEWMGAAAADGGRPLTGGPRPHFLRGISALLRAPTADGDLFLKAVFPPFHAEPVITRFLAERFPTSVPRVVDIEADEGWLLVEDVGAAWISGLRAGRREAVALGARSLVAIQRDLAGRPEDLAALERAGAPHRPLDRIPAELDRVLAPGGLGVAGETIAPDRRRALVAGISAAVSRLAGLAIPETLVHGDFHTDNVALAGERPVIIDWSDAAVGSPLVDLVTWTAWTESDEEAASATDAWIDAWSPAADREALRLRLDDVLAAGAAYQVISYDGIGRGLEPATRYTMVGGGDNFLKRLEDRLAAPTATS